MPNPRFWEIEDREINFGTINAKTTDHLLMTFAEMGLVYGNDWFVIPYELPVNSLCQVEGLVVTDVFGDRTLIRAANDATDTQWQRWSMFNISGQDGDAWRGRYFFLPSSTTQVHESEPIERWPSSAMKWPTSHGPWSRRSRMRLARAWRPGSSL